MQESFITHYVISAFCLKLLDIVVLILSQVNLENKKASQRSSSFYQLSL